MKSTKNVPDRKQTRSKKDPSHQECGQTGAASENEREYLDLSEARIAGYSDGGQDEIAENRSRRIPEADLSGFDGVGGVEVKRGSGAAGTEAHVGHNCHG